MHHATSRKFTGSGTDVVIDFLNVPNPSFSTMSLKLSQSLPEDLSGAKSVVSAWGWQSHWHRWVDCPENVVYSIWSSMNCYRDSFTCYVMELLVWTRWGSCIIEQIRILFHFTKFHMQTLAKYSSSCVHCSAGKDLQVWSWSSSRSAPVQYSLIFLPLNALSLELLTTSLNAP
jgi:hypothetical protein